MVVMARDWQMRASIALLVTLVFVVASVATLYSKVSWRAIALIRLVSLSP